MKEVTVWKIVDAAFDLAELKFNRDEIVAMARAMQAEGKSAEEVADWVSDFRKQKAAEVRQKVNDSPDD